ncbi:hypothetical protein C8A00DRAFT_16129 [Chaetomidium leptoderma]|uniref:Cytochrome b561 domain-containing protein n=1 Tax=Chaetomidium leptoderma TaxID=669021 RepID=A0AAN6ZUN1_9PEZI|nr:hypothetical protein C8A00DRAFT_16129 [Chaetomidium leptoderma]
MTTLLSLAVLSLQFLVALAEQVQYCRFGHPNGDVDFCMGVSSSLNTTTTHHDLHITLSVRRSSALGWTAVGTGPSMAGALMFIVYGDPSAGADPVVSVRNAEGHHQPRLITPAFAGGADIQITSAKWQPLSPQDIDRRHEDHDPPPPLPTGPPTHVALVSLICYSCTLFPGSSISATTSSQPFIWAWNDRQRFESYEMDAHLTMHHHGRRSGGFGKFYADMTHALSNSSAPPAALPLAGGGGTLLMIGTSDSPIGVAGWFSALWENPLARAHGFVMGLAFVAVFPLGVVFIRLGGKPGVPFRRHWMVQAIASSLALTGAVAGAVMSGGRWPRTVHQWLGVGIVLGLAVQVLLGWTHHLRFMRIRRRTWVSYGHIWLGRVSVVSGWVNVMLGMWLTAAALSFFLSRQRGVKKQAASEEVESEAHALMLRDTAADDYFVLEMSDDEDTSEGEDEALQKQPGGGEKYDRKQSLDIRVVEG